MDYITLNGLEVGAGFTDIKSSGYHLAISFMDTPRYCLVVSAWLFGKTSLYLNIMCIGRQIWDEIRVRLKVKCVEKSKGVCSLGLDVALRFGKTELEKPLRRKRLAQMDLQER